MLARLQQVTTFCLLALALGWLIHHWGQSPLQAVAGLITILLSYAGFLAAEFLLLRRLNRDQMNGAPSWRQLALAWWQEVTIAPQVFCWLQPFRAQIIADAIDAEHPRSRRGVVLIHGFVCNRGLWSPWLRLLRQHRRAFVAVNLEPVFGSIDDYAITIDQAVAKVQAATGLPPLLVCHSMGGLAARAWLQRRDAAARVWRVVTIGSPHHGTWLGRFAWSANGRQMQLASPWLRALAQAEDPAVYARFTCWYSNADNIVMPTATATLAGAENRFLLACSHVAMAWHPQIIAHTLEMLEDDGEGAGSERPSP